MGVSRRGLLKGAGIAGVSAAGFGAGWAAYSTPAIRNGMGLLTDPVLHRHLNDLGEEYWEVATNLQGYLQPEHEVVTRFADHATIHTNNYSWIDVDHLQPYEFDYALDVDTFGTPEEWLYPFEYLPGNLETLEREPGYDGRDVAPLTGDCEDYALAMCSVLTAMGYDSKILVGIEETKGSTPGHAAVEFRDDDAYYRMDISDVLLISEQDAFDDAFDRSFHPVLMFGPETVDNPHNPVEYYDPDWGRTDP